MALFLLVVCHFIQYGLAAPLSVGCLLPAVHTFLDQTYLSSPAYKLSDGDRQIAYTHSAPTLALKETR